jgi:hypothetical protein
MALLSLALPLRAAQKPCITADEASQRLHKNVCVTAHIYDVFEARDGTRYLDVCPPDTPDDLCRFMIVTFWQDRDDVGELQKYRNSDVNIRGLIEPMRGRAGMVLSHVRQFNGGPPKFRPNPLLARGFNAEQDRPPINDPNLRHQGGGRGFMNNSDRVANPSK